jgi:hypothetical protein
VRTALKNSANAKASATDGNRRPQSPALLPPEIESSGWKFSDTHRRLYAAMQENISARTAFQKLTTGPKAISPAILLLSLEAESFLRGMPRQDWKEWDRWKDKWEDLGRTAKSLKRIALKMEKQIQHSARGPIPLPTLLPTTEGEPEEKEREEYAWSLQANGRLTAITAGLRENASEIEHFCQMRRAWLRRMPRKHRDSIQSERHVLFLRFVESRTGKSHFEHLAALLNICKTVSQPESKSPEFSADYLRKLSNRFSTPLIKTHYPAR